MVSPEATSFFERHLASTEPPPAVQIPDDVRFEDVVAGGHPARWCIPAAADAETVVAVDAPWPAAVIFLSGVDGPLGAEPQAWAAQLASRSGVRVLLPTSAAPASDPQALDAVYRWLLDDGGFWSIHVALVAEGAAAAAAMALLDALVDTGRIPDGPGLVVLLSPCVAPGVADPLDRDRGADPPTHDPEDLRLGGDLVHSASGTGPGAATYRMPEASGARTIAANGAVVHVGGAEILIGDALAATRAFAADDVPVTLRVWPYQQHGFHRAVGGFVEADLITDDIATAVRGALRT